ncbi:MAG: hypothetical protein MUP76_11205 [Acidimicrobiia bacterium]|nr:hypothetical protein [Acidimicrobiia bacterium]
MSGERLIEHLIAKPEPVKALLQDFDTRLVSLERDTRQLATAASVIGVATFADLPDVDSLPPNAKAWIGDVGEVWSVVAAAWAHTGTLP